MKKIVVCFSICLSALSFAQNNYPLISKIAFGSCADENLDQPILSLILEHEHEHEPELFIYLGDNIYADTKSIEEL